MFTDSHGSISSVADVFTVGYNPSLSVSEPQFVSSNSTPDTIQLNSMSKVEAPAFSESTTK